MPPIKMLLKLAPVAGALLISPYASAATTSASFSVTSFSYNANGGTLTFAPSDDYQSLTAWSADAGGIADYQTNTSTVFAIENDGFVTTTGHASSNVEATAGRTIRGYGDATTSTYSTTAQPNKSASEALQSGTFTVTGGTGTVTFNVGYTLSLSAAGGNAFDTYSSADLVFMLGTYDGMTGGTASISHFSFDVASGVATYTGTLTETITFADATDVGYYNLQGDAFASASALAPVPEPSDWALMLAGLGVIGALGHQRRQRDSR